ncbi:MAG: cell cycle protein [Chloroflexi bacterium OLB14]|nr:MAG: cell cycle protein [Chloroflexi bacterium OLB14]
MNHHTQNRLLQYAGFFLFIQSIILTLSPAVRERTWNVDYRLSHWLGFFTWVILVFIANKVIQKKYSEADAYIFPAAALLSGWGLLTIWRLDSYFGMRQTIWFTVSMCAFIFTIQFLPNLSFLRKYKYVFLTSGAIITALTLIFGTNPLGFGPRLWLGVSNNIYFQPSEPLKILFVIYLSAYLADRANIDLFSSPLLIPTLFVTGMALLLLIVQRDLGTASIFILIFTIFIYIATGKRRILIASVLALFTALLIGYFFISIVQIRVIGWLNPWEDPTGNSYQIIQSLLAVANGGTIGRGLGIGSPLLVPVSISDFIFSAITEETGLIGSLCLILLIWLILARGMMASLKAPDKFRRYLAAGIVAYLGIQSILIIGGNIRLLPLTGVTLPFVSYGGSSLLTSFIALFLLLNISNIEDDEPATLENPQPYTLLTGTLALGLISCALITAYWSVIRGPDLLTRTDNPRRAIADRFVPRGEIVDVNNKSINITEKIDDVYVRKYLYPALASVTGYTHPVYGQAGLEFSLDSYLRGLQGNPSSLILWDQLLYGTPPAGLDVRLSIDLSLQAKADNLLGAHHGAIILMNAETGEILVMASHPSYDPNNLDTEGEKLSNDENAPLLNRATQGLYPFGDILLPLTLAKFGDKVPSVAELQSFYNQIGLYQTPTINMPASTDEGKTRLSPLQVSLLVASLSNNGNMPSARIATAINTLEQGWIVIPALSESKSINQAEENNEAVLSFLKNGKAYWSHVSQASVDKTVVTWFIGGTLPDWKGVPLALVIALEENNIPLSQFIGDSLLSE